MKNNIITLDRFLFILILFILNSNCTKPPAMKPIIPIDSLTHSRNFFAGTEWTGTAFNRGEYDAPCDLKFWGDTAVTIYAPFYFIDIVANVAEYDDSLQGKITKIDSLLDGRITVAVSYSKGGDNLKGEQQTFYISNKSTLAGISSTSLNGLNGAVLNLSITNGPAPVLGSSKNNTTWSGNAISGFANSNYYPDVSPVSFIAGNPGSGRLVFTRTVGGKNYVYNAYTFQGTIPDLWDYYQIGYRVYFKGYNEEPFGPFTGQGNRQDPVGLLDYYGVLEPGSTFMYVTSPSPKDGSVSYARLPTYVQINSNYGPAGVTPVIYPVKTP